MKILCQTTTHLARGILLTKVKSPSKSLSPSITELLLPLLLEEKVEISLGFVTRKISLNKKQTRDLFRGEFSSLSINLP
jgi:hypothetical protein